MSLQQSTDLSPKRAQAPSGKRRAALSFYIGSDQKLRVSRPGFPARVDSLGPTAFTIQGSQITIAQPPLLPPPITLQGTTMSHVRCTSTQAPAPLPAAPATPERDSRRSRLEYDIEERINFAHGGESPWLESNQQDKSCLPLRSRLQQKECSPPTSSPFHITRHNFTKEISPQILLKPGTENTIISPPKMSTDNNDTTDPFADSVPTYPSLHAVCSWESGDSEKLTQAGKSGRYHRKVLKEVATIPDLRNTATAPPVTGLRQRSVPAATDPEFQRMVEKGREEAQVVRKTRHLSQAWEEARIKREERERRKEEERIREEREKARQRLEGSPDSTFDKVLRVTNPDPEPEPEPEPEKKAKKKKSVKLRELWSRLSMGSSRSRSSSPAVSERG